MPNMSLKKNPMPAQEPAVRAHNFDEVALGYTPEQAMDEAARAGRCVILSDGKLALDGPPADIFTRVETLKSLGLAPPQTVSLLYELQKEGLPLSLSAVGVDACAEELRRLLQNPVIE